jgi:phosphoribosylamine--glycine ligase
MLDSKSLGAAGREVLVEEHMEGEEVSVFALCGGDQSRLMIGAQDHKRLNDGDFGPNTGGMGAYAPVSLDTPGLQEFIKTKIIDPTLTALLALGAPFTGLLYVGIMLTRTGPKVVEFNCRFGDPETQTLLPLLESSLLEPLLIVARGESLANAGELVWRKQASVTTVLAASGYPVDVRKGDPITFPPPSAGVYVFHAGTRAAPNAAVLPTADPPVLTDGGRVLSVTAVAPTLARAALISRTYAERIRFAGKQMRNDIGWRELRRGSTTRHA